MANIKRNQAGLNPFELDFTNFLDDFFGNNLYNVSNLGKTNIQEFDNNYLIELQIPGFTKDDINLNLENGTLKVEGEVKNENEEKGNVHRKEFKKSSFVRSFQIPEDVSAEEIEANMENGILSIKAPKKELKQKDKKQIEIK